MAGGCLNWINLAQDRDRWWALVNAAINLKMRGISSLAEDMLACQEGLFSMELVS